MNYSLASKAYETYSSYHAIFLLHIIHARKLEPLSASLVEKIAQSLIYCGDYFPEDNSHYQDPVLPKIMTFIHSILDRTALPSTTTVEDAIRHSCETQSSIPMICSATTTISALYYLNQFKQKYGVFTQSAYVTQRLFLVAYLVAAKYIHANLKSLVIHDCSNHRHANHETSPHQQHQQQQETQPYHYIPTIQTPITLSSSTSPTPTTAMLPSPSETHDQQQQHFDTWTSVTREAAAQFLEQVGDVFPTEQQSMTPTQLCSMEMEFVHFLDYQLCIGPSNPLHLWSWFYTKLEEYCQLYHTTVGIGSNYVGPVNSNNTATTAL